MHVKFFNILLILVCRFCFGGWYECYNYNGSIGKYPIDLSFQIMDRRFSDTTFYKVIGIYRYKSKNNPILLYGDFDVTNSRLKIYEYKEKLINGNFDNFLYPPKDSSAVFAFGFDTITINGTWTNLETNQKLPLHMNFISKLIDFSLECTDTLISIPQSFSMKDKYFVGEYIYNPANFSRGKMTFLKIIDKKTDSLFQIIDLTKYTVPFGSVSTIIYDNVSITKKGFWIWSDYGKHGTEIDFILNKKKNYYEMTNKYTEILID